MAVYNGASYLKKSAGSILSQAYSDFEFLIIDDGSIDDSVKILESFKDKRIRIVKNNVNLGQTHSLNNGLKLAQGQFIARIDCDDLAFPDWLKEQVKYLEGCQDAAVVSCTAVIIDMANRIQRLLKSSMTQQDALLRSLTSTPINHVGCMMQKDVMLQAGGYDEALKVAADYELWSRLLRAGAKITSTQKPLVAIRVHPSSVSIQEKQRGTLFEIRDIIMRNFAALARYPISQEDALLIAKIDYQPMSLASEDLTKVDGLLNEGFARLGANFQWPESRTKSHWKNLMKIMTVKCIFDSIEKKDFAKARRLCCDDMARHGKGSIVFVIYLFTFLGQGLTKQLPRWHQHWLQFKARLKFPGRLQLG